MRVAFDLFGKHGYQRVSAEDIASAAGVSRATFFNYFPQKELLLREIAEARVEKLKRILAAIEAGGTTPTCDAITDLVVQLTAENARISKNSKQLLLEVFFHQASHGLLLSARGQAIEALAAVIARIPGQKKRATLAGETVFAVYIATMLEWLMREGVSQKWLVNTMRDRLQIVRRGIA